MGRWGERLAEIREEYLRVLEEMDAVRRELAQLESELSVRMEESPGPGLTIRGVSGTVDINNES